MKTQKKALVTGGAGYIGSRLVEKLTLSGYKVIVIDSLVHGKKSNISKSVKFYNVDIRSKQIRTIIKKEKPHIIFHLAALKDITESLKNPIEFADVNIMGSLNVLEAARQNGIKKFIFTSTAAVYGNELNSGYHSENQIPNPFSSYGASKLAVEGYIKYYNNVHGMEGIILRFANVYGPGGEMKYNGVINTFITQASKGKELLVHGDGRQTRDFICTDDITDLCLQLAVSNYHVFTKEKFIFNVSTGKEVSILQIISLLKQSFKTRINLKIHRQIPSGQRRSILNPKLINDVLGWSTKISLEKGIPLTCDNLVVSKNKFTKKVTLYE